MGREQNIKWEGKPQPISPNTDGVTKAVGPEAAADMLCLLREDAQGLRRIMAEIKTQNSEVVAAQAQTNKLLASIAEKLDRQHEQGERLAEVANKNTDRLCSASEKKDGTTK